MASEPLAQSRGTLNAGAAAPPSREGGEWLVEEDADKNLELAARVKLASDLAMTLERTLKSFRQFGMRHRTSQNFVTEIVRKFQAFHSAHGELAVGVFGCDLLYEGESIYSDQEIRQSYPFILFRDGIQRVIFEPGVEAEEIQKFLTLLRDQTALGSATGMEDDLVTLLWDADLKHLRYVVSESFKQEEKDEAREAQRKDLVDQLTEDANAATLAVDLSARFVRPTREHELRRAQEDIDFAAAWERGNTIVNDDAARAALASQVDSDETLLRKFLEIVFGEILEQKEPRVRRELIGFVRDFAIEATRRDRLAEAIGVLRALGDLARLAGDDGRRVAQEVLAQIATPEVLAELMRQLELADDEGTQQLLTFLALIPPREARGLVPVMQTVTLAARRRAVCQLLSDRLGDDLASVGDQIRDADEGLALDLIHLLKNSKWPRARVELLVALDHLSTFVRRDAFDSIRAGAPAGDPTVIGAALLLLDDEQQDLRRLALLSLPRAVDSEVARRLRTVIGRVGFDRWDYSDKRRAFLAYAASAGKRASKDLIEVLQTNTMFKNEELEDRRCCAAFALASLGDEAHEAILEAEAKRMFGGKRIKDACENALALLKFKKPVEPDAAGSVVAPSAVEQVVAVDTSHLPSPIWLENETAADARASILDAPRPTEVAPASVAVASRRLA